MSYTFFTETYSVLDSSNSWINWMETRQVFQKKPNSVTGT